MKTTLINEVWQLIDPRPAVKIFRGVGGDLYSHEGKQLTRAQCEKIDCKLKIFVERKQRAL